MVKEKVRQLNGVFASVFAYAGHITKEEAKEISGLADHEFEKAYAGHLTSLKKPYKPKGKRWISSWSILQKRLSGTWIILAGNYSSRKVSCVFKDPGSVGVVAGP